MQIKNKKNGKQGWAKQRKGSGGFTLPVIE